MRQTFWRVEIIELMIRFRCFKGIQIHNIKTKCEMMHLTWALIKTFFKILMFQYDLNFSKYLISNFHIFIRHLTLQNMTWLCIETTWTCIDMISSMTGSRCYISRENYQRSGRVISFVPVQRLWILLYHLHSQATPAKPHNPHSGRSFCKTYTLMCPPSLRGVKPRKDEIAGSEWP